ncbi:MAG: hypothetical protein H7X93_04110 [Sphingomonadaceae bacterium]|nr:hypothetical protein [Sphingomonadaceae bacterium]
MAAETGLCPPCRAELGQGREASEAGPDALGNAGVEIPARRPPTGNVKHIIRVLAVALVIGVAAWLVFALENGGERAVDKPEPSNAASSSDERPGEERVDRDWLIGAWVEWPDSVDNAQAATLCGTDNAVRFYADGTYRTFDERGAFELTGNRLDLITTERDAPDFDKDTGIERPRSFTYMLVRVDEDVGRWVHGPESSFRVRRC